jgi:Tol biopolymer transport system component
LGRDVALKILRAHFTNDDAGRVARFQSEARAASALNHANIVTIYEIGHDHGIWFIATELIQGVTVRERLRSGRIRAEEALQIANQCASALATAHRAGIVHRDIKPENIMVRPDGVAKLVDFGLARILEPGAEWLPEATQAGSIMGTPRYMSPEQARGQKPDARSDIFSLGAVLFEMIAGRAAFPGTTTAEVFAALLGPEPDIADAGPLRSVISRALAKEPGARYQSMEEFANDLRDVDLFESKHLLKPDKENRRHRPRTGRSALLQTGAPQAVLLVAVFLAVTALAAYSWLYRRDVPSDVNLKFTPLTTFGGSKAYPAFSPDAHRIAFSWRASNKETHHIYVKPVANGEPVQLTFGSEEDTFPTWSPDGRQIAFCRRASSPDERAPVPSGVYIVPALGGAARKVTENCAGVSWSPDGKTLALARTPNGAPDSGGIDLLFLKSGVRRRLTSSRQDMLPTFSPNGKWLAFIRVLPGRGRGREVFVVPAKGGRARQLTSDGEYITGVTWTADSGEMVLSSPRNRAQGSFWRIRLSGGSPRPLSAALRNASYPCVSRQGGRLAFTESWSDSNIHLRTGPGFPRAGMLWRFDEPMGVAVSTGTEHTPVFSPDGERFAFVSDRTGNNEIWVSRRDGSATTQLTSLGSESAGSPRWSPDGAWIAFDVWASNESNVYVVGSRGGAPRRVSLEPGESWSPAWAPDAKWIYFTSQRSGSGQIWKMPAAGGAATQVTFGGAYEGRTSDDGTIYFRKSTPGGCCAIWSVPAAGGREEPVPELEKFARISRSWGALKQGIYFIAKENEPRQTVRFFSFGTREVADVVRLDKEPDWSYLGLAMSADGRYLLTVQIDREANDLMMIENFR